MTQSDQRPSVWVGHIVLNVGNVEASKAFFLKLGMRDVAPEANIGVLELRGGTHLVILPTDDPVAENSTAGFRSHGRRHRGRPRELSRDGDRSFANDIQQNSHIL